MKAIVLLLLIGTVCWTLAKSMAAEQQSNEAQCQSSIEMYCLRCHGYDRICGALGAMDKEQWRITINKMAEYAALNEGTREVIFSCLATMAANDPLLCKDK